MVAIPEIAAAWNATPLTKFRPPRVRRDVIARPALLERLAYSIDQLPVTLICAPGGFGKTTLLAQFAAQLAAHTPLLWITLDEDDSERHRLFATLVRALEPLSLAWEMPPGMLLAHASGTDSQSRAALAAVVNALCTAPASRIVLILDDLHRIEDADALGLLESFIERLPDHVALVLGSRVEPALPLVRWRAHGELAEFVPWDLQFSEAETSTLVQSRLGSSSNPEQVREIWRRTHGWAVGLTVALQAQQRGIHGVGERADTDSDRHLFEYLAQEILADLPAHVRTFLLECSVLFELSPAACEAVTGLRDAQDMLKLIYRRNLFVTATDDSLPVLRFHDLFREFLLSELERTFPERVRDLHARAGRAETSLPRAIAHWVQAECWEDAMRLIALNGENMLSEGDHALLEQWLDRIPHSVRRADPKLCYLRGVCAWLKWDWRLVREELAPAIAGLDVPEHAAMRVRAMFLQVDALNSSGERELAWQILDDLQTLPLDPPARAQLALQRGWCVLPTGAPDAVGEYMSDFIACAERDPASICPRTADRVHLLCIGLPKVAACFERFYALSELVRSKSAAPWQLAALAIGAWGVFWQGRREPLLPILERGDALHQQFGSMRLVSERLLQFRALFHAASGRYEAAQTLTQTLIEGLQTASSDAHRAVWLRAYQHGHARICWMARNYEGFRALAPALLAPRVANEWPFIDAATALVRGQLCILREDWRTAESELECAVQIHERFRMPMIYGDPRVSLAYAHHCRGRRTQAWHAFDPVFQEVLDQQAIGLLLLEPPHVIDALLEIVPAEKRRSAAFDSLMARLGLWRPTGSDTASVPALGPLGVLSDREREVLERVAAGASNKHIARELTLSLHTVKRHIANILDKLDCASRGQAADVYRRAAG